MRKYIMLTAMLALLSGNAYASGKAQGLHVKDGDSFVLNGKEYRLHAIDALEYSQVCLEGSKVLDVYGRAKAFLTSLLRAGTIKCEVLQQDQYRRNVAICYQNGRDINAMMVREGYAFANPRYSTRYVKDENSAKNENKWIHRCQGTEKPWEFRKRVKFRF